MLFTLRLLLLPLSILYGLITSIRNTLYNLKVLKSTSFDFPVITVGNLSVGGTGKTPQIEYLIRLLQDKHNIAVLSRGYKRKSEGFVLANAQSTVLDLGDEPYQYHQKFKKIQVAVNGNRVEGVKGILANNPETDLVLLDDAYQHRKIKAGYHILLSSYDKLFYQDFMMPTGNLRELWWGKNRADVIVVTKCPEDLSDAEQSKIVKKIRPKKGQQILFSKIVYDETLKGTQDLNLDSLNNKKVTLVTGIAKPKPLVTFLKNKGLVFEHLEFPDHHHFTKTELEDLKNRAKNQLILTTEKDYVRLENELNNLYYLPIKIEFLNNGDVFNKHILNFVKTKSTLNK